MSKLEIKGLKITNFKGIKSAELSFESGKNTIKGRNGSGKTSIKNAFEWLMYQNVDNIIPNKENKEILGLETEVEADFLINGSIYNFRRTRKDSFDKTTGNKKGNDFKYFVDDMELEAKQYQNKLVALLGNGVLENINILIDSEFFNADTSSWKWTNRRKVLFEISNTNKALETILSQEKYAEIKKSLDKGNTTNDIKALTTKQIKNLKQGQEKNQNLIEYNRELEKELAEIDFEAVEKELAETNAELDALSNADNNEFTSKKIAEITSELLAKNQELANMEKALLVEQNELRKTVNNLYNEAKETYAKYEAYQEEIKHIEQQLDKLENDFTDTCPICKQKLPEQDIEKQIANIESEKQNYKEQLEIKQTKLKEFGKKYKELQKEYTDKKEKLDNFELRTDTIDLKTTIKDLEIALKSEKTQNLNKSRQEDKLALQDKLKGLYKTLAQKDQLDKIRKEINAKQQENRDFASQIIELEDKQDLLAEFVKEQIEIVNNSVNKNFGNGISFALYNETYKNGEGGLEETCVCMYEGKRYESLSNGEKAIANIEVLKVLQNYYNSQITLFLDNAESVSIPYDIDSQVIELRVDKDCVIDQIEKI